MSGLPDVLEEHFDKYDARVVDSVLRTGAAYSDGDAFAGSKLKNISSEGWENLTDLFEEAGLDASFGSRMDVVGFLNEPDTGDERLDAEVRGL